MYQSTIQTGILSKSRGQVLQLTAIMHMLFNIDNVDQQLEEVEESAIKAAVNFIQLACQQTAFITGKGTLHEEMEKLKTGMVLYIYINSQYRSLRLTGFKVHQS